MGMFTKDKEKKRDKESGQVKNKNLPEMDLQVEDLGGEEETDAPKGEKKSRNPFLVPLILVSVLLAVLGAAFIGGSFYLKMLREQESKEAAALLETKEELRALEEAAQKQAEKELAKRLEEVKQAGRSEGEKEVLEQIQRSLDSGASVVEVFRMLYRDQLVVASGGRYHFIPIDPELKKNPYSMENLVIGESGELSYMQNGEVTSYKGIDVSKFQGKIDWQKVAEDGVSFAFVRVGYRGYGAKGVMAEDETARDNLQGANDAGVKVGVYYYTQAITEAEALEEADAVLELIASYQIDCPVVIDVEKVSASTGRMNALDAATRTQIVKTFCERIKAAGYRPMIYHNLEMGAVLLNIKELEEYDKWFAYYKNELYYPYAYRVWQYSDKGRVQGISGDVDLNIAFDPLWE